MEPTNEIDRTEITATAQTCEATQPAACHHMERCVTALADGSLTGAARLYTRFHVATCPKCAAALRSRQKSECQAEVSEAVTPGENGG